MERRSFLKLAGMLIGGVVLEEAIPLGRVWSFPGTIALHKPNVLLTVDYVTREALGVLSRTLRMPNHLAQILNEGYGGGGIAIRAPKRYVIEHFL